MDDPVIITFAVVGFLGIIGYAINLIKFLGCLITHRFDKVFFLRLLGVFILPLGMIVGLLVWGHSEWDK